MRLSKLHNKIRVHISGTNKVVERVRHETEYGYYIIYNGQKYGIESTAFGYYTKNW